MTQQTAGSNTFEGGQRWHLLVGGLRKKWLIGTLVAGVLWLAAGIILQCRALIAMEKRALYQAERCLLWAERLRPWDDEPTLLRARVARWRGAAKEWEELSSQGRSTPIAAAPWLLEAKLFAIAEGKLQLDLPYCRRLMSASRSPDDVAEAFVVGFSKRRMYGPALEILEAWKADSPDSAHVTFLKGLVAMAAQERNAARSAWEETLIREPQHELARQALIELLITEDQLTDALRQSILQYKQTLASPGASILIARCLRLLGRTVDAQQWLEKPSTSLQVAEWSIERGHLAYESGDYKAAARWFEDAHLSAESDPLLLMTVASVSAFAGQTDRAKQCRDWASKAIAVEGLRRETIIRNSLGRDEE